MKNSFPPKPSKVRAFLSRRRHWLALLGAVIMLSTFVVKEVWRDEVKRKGDSLASKLVVLQYRNDVIDIREGTSRIQAGLDRILHTYGQTDHPAEVAAGA